MKYYEYKVFTDAGKLDQLVESFNEAGFYGIIINDPRDAAVFDGDGTGYEWNYVDEEVVSGLKEAAYVRFYIREGEAMPPEVSGIIRGHEVSRTLTDDQDWLHKWEEHYVPIRLSERLVAKPAWKSFDAQPGDVVIEIEPGLAFGTGGHETTRLCLEMCEKYMKPGDSVLDVGCGSGILGIAALLCGASKAVGVDIDEKAVDTARENAALNGVGDRFTAICGSFTDKVQGKYDIVLANIVADAIMFLSKGVADFMKDDAVYVMSGIIDTRAAEVKAEVSKYFDIIEEHLDGGWACFAAKRK